MIPLRKPHKKAIFAPKTAGKAAVNIEVYYRYQEISADKSAKRYSGGFRCSGKTKTTYNKSYLIVTHG